MSSLVLRLSGPMQSWGLQSRFSVRDTGREPSKSGVVGILCAALGFPRNADCHRYGDRLIGFDEVVGLKMAVRVDREGTVRRDYHTAGGGKLAGVARYGVAKANRAAPGTVTSARYYLADADFRVALESDDEVLLRVLESALRKPKWPIFFGRKSFVPGSPLLLDRPEAGGLRPGRSCGETIESESWYYRTEQERTRIQADPQLRIVTEMDSSADSSEIRPDVPVSFATRDFTIRHVSTGFISLPSSLIEEDPACIFPASG